MVWLWDNEIVWGSFNVTARVIAGSEVIIKKGISNIKKLLL